MPALTILLPVFDGARYLEAQLESLLAQTYPDWVCLIRDDGSRDDSAAIARGFAERYPQRFTVVQDALGNLGTVGCLNRLATHVETPLFALCDQDDVWLADKLWRTVDALRLLTASWDGPALAFCDMTVADSDLRTVASSFWDLMAARRYAQRLRGMPVINAVAGCSMVGNRDLLHAAFPVPACAPMHDYWIGMVTAYAGRCTAIEDSLMLYRQHGANQCGSASPRSLRARTKARLRSLRTFRDEAARLRTIRKAMLTELLDRRVSSTDVAACRLALAAEAGSPLDRLRFLITKGIQPASAFVYWLA